jgi:uncharacterized protein YycO
MPDASAFIYKIGNILLRAGEKWILDLTKSSYSHAGICVDPSTAADAHPEDKYHTATNSVGRVPISEFFSKEHASNGGIYRYKYDSTHAEKAGEWADNQVGKPYIFCIEDPILGSDMGLQDNNSIYCSEFVWLAYKRGADIELVKATDFMNLLSDENIENTVEVLTEYLRKKGEIPKLAPAFAVRKGVTMELKKRHNGYFIAPSQFASSPLVEEVGLIG